MVKTLKDLKVEAFPSFVEKVANMVSPIQQTLTTLEKALLALKGENNCSNNNDVMNAAIEFQDQAEAFLSGLNEVGAAHKDSFHNTGEGVEGEEVEIKTLGDLLELLAKATGGFRGTTH